MPLLLNHFSFLCHFPKWLYFNSWNLTSFQLVLPHCQTLSKCFSSSLAPPPPPSKPHFISRLPFELKLPHGDPLILKCLVEGHPKPNINWFKDGIPLKNDPRYRIDFKDGEASLRIPESFQDDGGVYSCLATNPSGQDSTTSNVTVGGWCSIYCHYSSMYLRLTLSHVCNVGSLYSSIIQLFNQASRQSTAPPLPSFSLYSMLS